MDTNGSVLAHKKSNGSASAVLTNENVFARHFNIILSQRRTVSAAMNGLAHLLAQEYDCIPGTKNPANHFAKFCEHVNQLLDIRNPLHFERFLFSAEGERFAREAYGAEGKTLAAARGTARKIWLEEHYSEKLLRALGFAITPVGGRLTIEWGNLERFGPGHELFDAAIRALPPMKTSAGFEAGWAELVAEFWFLRGLPYTTISDEATSSEFRHDCADLLGRYWLARDLIREDERAAFASLLVTAALRKDLGKPFDLYSSFDAVPSEYRAGIQKVCEDSGYDPFAFQGGPHAGNEAEERGKPLTLCGVRVPLQHNRALIMRLEEFSSDALRVLMEKNISLRFIVSEGTTAIAELDEMLSLLQFDAIVLEASQATGILTDALILISEKYGASMPVFVVFPSPPAQFIHAELLERGATRIAVQSVSGNG